MAIKRQRLYPFIHAPSDYASLILRVLMGVVIYPHGAQKLFGKYGGFGFEGTLNYFTDVVGIPWILGLTIILLETIGSVFLILGFASRLFAISFTFLGMGIMFTSHIEHGFFMNWYGNQSGEGIEYFLLWFGITLSIMLVGGGRFSVDYYLRKIKTRVAC